MSWLYQPFVFEEVAAPPSTTKEGKVFIHGESIVFANNHLRREVFYIKNVFESFIESSDNK